jgi:TRAP-type mannitol/chloroaromatic compound transport system permease small subunit
MYSTINQKRIELFFKSQDIEKSEELINVLNFINYFIPFLFFLVFSIYFVYSHLARKIFTDQNQ